MRYPGGKGALAPFFGDLLSLQSRNTQTYVELFAGGAGAAVRLLIDEFVERIVLNDLNRGVAALWQAVFSRTEELAKRISSCPVSVSEWHQQRSVYQNATINDPLELGFATLFLNRTNRSGILSARPIGGLEQEGRWKIDARFNRADIAERIRMLGRYRNRVLVLNEDALNIAEHFLNETQASFVYLDPPYLANGSGLYLGPLAWKHHQELAKVVQGSSGNWMVTYDTDHRVLSDLYPRRRWLEFRLAHTAAIQHVGSEFAIFSDSLKLPSFDGVLKPA